MANQARKSVVHRSEQTYGGSFHADLVEQYKLYVQSAENVSARRGCFGPVPADRECGPRRAVRATVRKFWPALLDPARSHRWSFRFRSLVFRHQVTRRPEPHQVRRDPRTGAAFTGGDVQTRVGFGRGGPRQELPGSDTHRTMVADAVRCTARSFGYHNPSRNRWGHGLGEMTTIVEADVEQAALAWLVGLGWQVAHGPDIAPDTSGAERSDYRVRQRTI